MDTITTPPSVHTTPRHYAAIHPAAGGALSGKYTDGTALPNSRMSLWPERYARFIAPRTLRAVEKYAAIAAEAGLTPAQLGYAFVRRWVLVTTAAN